MLTPDELTARAIERLKPAMPAELWMLWITDEDGENGKWLVSVDDAPGGTTYLACFTEDEAIAAIEHQALTYGTENVTPIRVK